MLFGALAALAAALCWTLASGLWRRLSTSLSGAELNLLKNWLALVMLLPLVLGRPWPAAPGALVLLALSGVLGIALGDSLYFAALRRLGTRRTLTIDAGGPAVAALGGLVWLAEVPAPLQWIGLGLITLALLLVAVQRPTSAAEGRLQLQGVALAVGALLCGSGGALMSRAALRDAALDPLQSAWVRLLAAALVLLPLLRGWRHRGWGPRPSARRWPLGLLATLLGTTAGIALQQMALQRLPGGIAVALLATAPLMAIPLAHLEGDQPGWRGWLAALLALAGVSALVV
ncbi:EamA family transporter [Synechococcus sp. CB0101]|uniref:EamA family transporter n=1 Tax=Synechococcus sp. CB0101 TaxID=232348 RepID=UPI0002002611|nr:EamA family transporter [Synechococcus sp. CB0101]QCH15908.1 EamA family transporter [Synechococcus sp. CB0101]